MTFKCWGVVSTLNTLCKPVNLSLHSTREEAERMAEALDREAAEGHDYRACAVYDWHGVDFYDTGCGVAVANKVGFPVAWMYLDTKTPSQP